jgi:small redox-active disulfide protein 2
MAGDVKLLWVESGQVGIVGLDQVLEEAKGKGLAGDILRKFLLEEVKRRNYVPASAEEAYGEALVRAYRRYCGEAVEDIPSGILSVQVLGPGCPECDHLEQEVKDVLSELGIGGNVEHIRDPEQIGKYGIFGGPGLVVNGRLVAAGKVPRRRELVDMLKKLEADSSDQEGRMKIEVFGPGCARCTKTEETVREVVRDAGIEAEVVKVKDIQEMASRGVLRTPAVFVDGKKMSEGRVPGPDEIRQWLLGKRAG